MLDILVLLLERISDLQAKGRFTKYLRAIKDRREISRRDFLTSGTNEELATSIVSAIQANAITLTDIISFVDTVEENGAQHLIPFTMTECNTENLLSLSESSTTPPHTELYSQLPSGMNPFVYRRGDKFLIKQVRTAEYWVVDGDSSFESETQKAQYWTRRSHRSVNCVLIDPTSMSAQIRISRVSADAPRDLWRSLYCDVWDSLEGIVAPPRTTFVPEALWRGFGRIARTRDGTFMAADSARSPQIFHHIRSRREAGRGEDIRNLEPYDMGSDDYARDSLNIWWLIPDHIGDDERVHTILTKEAISNGSDDIDICKVWLARHVTPEVLEYVVERIRETAS